MAMNAPFILQSQDVDNVHVQSDEQASRTLVPKQPHVSHKAVLRRTCAYQSAVATKHIVLPTYMGSLSTLNGKGCAFPDVLPPWEGVRLASPGVSGC